MKNKQKLFDHKKYLIDHLEPSQISVKTQQRAGLKK